MGNLVADAEVRYTQTGQPVTSCRIACNERFFSNNTQQERTEFFNLVMWGRRGPGLVKAGALGKGQALYVQGRLQNRSFTGQDGNTRYVTEVVVGPTDADFQLLGRRGTQSQGAPPPDAPPPADADAPPDLGAEAPDDVF